jgi:hypothetical protein
MTETPVVSSLVCPAPGMGWDAFGDDRLTQTQGVYCFGMEDASKNEILEAIGDFSSKVDERFVSIEGRLSKIEANMVTKDYLDDRLLNMKGDMVVMMRKEDEKVKTLVQILKQKNLLNDSEAKLILALEPFPNR